mgnify:CR=1 FL=1
MSLGIEEDNKKTDEHILVCLSAAPSNKKIIDTAAKMANALQARLQPCTFALAQNQKT